MKESKVLDSEIELLQEKLDPNLEKQGHEEIIFSI